MTRRAAAGRAARCASSTSRCRFRAGRILVGIAPVHVAERHDILACEVDQISTAHAADTNGGDVECVAWRSESTAEDVSRNNGTRGSASSNFGEEGATRDFFLFAHDYLSRATCIIARSWSLCEGKL